MNTAVTSSQIETVAQNNTSNIESPTVSSSSSPSFKATNVEQHIQKDYLDESSFLKQNNIGNRHRGGGKGKHLTRSHAMRESTSPPRTPTQRSTGNDIMLSSSPNTTLSPSTSSINFLQSNDEQQCLHVQSQISPSKSPTSTTDTTLLVTGHLQQHQNYEIIYDKENRCPSDDEKINHQNNCESPTNLHNNTNDRCNNKKHNAGAKSTKPRLKTMGSSSSVEGCNNSSGFISRDNSTEQFTDQSGIDLIQFFKETLNKNDKDRCMLLRIENDLFCLIDDEKRDSMRFPPMSSYNRMLIHRTAAYFGMDHNLDPTQQSVVVTMSKLTRVPDIRFNSLINDLLEEPKKSILKRDTHSFDECRQGLLGCPERGLLDRKSKSFEEREEEYERARRRIFKGREQQLQLHQHHHHHQHLQQQEQEIGTNEIHWPWTSSESTENSSRLKAQNNRLLKVQSVCIDARPDGRPCVSKSHSFGGYGRHSCGQTGLSRDDSVTSTKSAGPRLFSKQDSTGSTNTPWRLSPSSSGYKTQSLRSDSVTPSPTGYGSGDHTPEPSILQSPTTTISSTSSINNNSYNINTNTLINEPNVNVPQSASTTCGVVWAVTDMASVPRGSVLIDPQTLQPIVNQDGSLYHFDPLNLPSTNNMANKPPTILRKKTKAINNVNIIDANCSSTVNTEDYVMNNNNIDNNNKNICNINNNNSNNRINKDQTNETVSNDNINASASTKIETNYINHEEKCYTNDDVNNNINNLNINDDENVNEDNNCCINTKLDDINESLNIKTKDCEMKDIEEESSASPPLDNINEKSESEMQINLNNCSTLNAQQKSQATSPKSPQMQSDLQNNEITNNLEKVNKTEISNVSGNTNSYKVNNMTMTNNYNSQNTHQSYTQHNSTPHYSNSHHNYHINNHHYENSNVNNKKDDINNYKVAAIPVMSYTSGYPAIENGTVFPAGAANGTTYSAYQQGVDGNMYAIPQQMVYTYPQALDVEVPGYFLPMYDQSCNAGQTRDATTGAIITGAGSSGSATFHPSSVAAPTATVVAAPGSTAVLPITYPQSGYGNSPIYQGQVVYASDQFAAATTTPTQYPISYPLAYPFPYNGTTYQGYWGHPMTTYYVPQPQQLTSTVLSHTGVPSTVSTQAQNTTGILINQTPTNGITLNGPNNNSGNGKRYTPPQHQHHHPQQIHQPQQSHSASSTPAATNATTFTPFSTGMHIPIAESPSSAAVAAATMYNSIPQPVYSNMLPYAGAQANASAAGLIPHPIPHHQHGAMINQIIPSNLHTSVSDPSIITSATTNGSHNSLSNNGGASNGSHNTATPQSTPSTPLSLPLPLPNQKNPPLFATPTILPNGFPTNLNGSTTHQNGGDVIVGFNNYERKTHPFSLTRRNGNITLNRQLGYTPQNQHHFYNNQRKTSVTNSVENIVNRGNVTNNNQPHSTIKRNDLANANKQSQTAISTINTAHGSTNISTERARGYRQKPANLDLRRSNTTTNNINNSNRNTPSTNSADSNNSPNSISSAGFDQQHHHQHIQMYMQRGTHLPPMHHSHATAIHDPTSHQQLITYNPAGMPAGGVYVKYGQQTYYTHPSMTTSALQNNRRSPPNDIRPTLTPITGVYPAVNMMLPGISTASHLPPSSNSAGWFLQQQLQRQQTNQIKKSTHITDLLYSNNLEDYQQHYNYNQYTIPPTAKYFYNHQYY